MWILVLAFFLPLFIFFLLVLNDYWEHKEALYRIKYGKERSEPETKSPDMFYYTEIKPAKQSHFNQTHPTRGAKL